MRYCRWQWGAKQKKKKKKKRKKKRKKRKEKRRKKKKRKQNKRKTNKLAPLWGTRLRGGYAISSDRYRYQ